MTSLTNEQQGVFHVIIKATKFNKGGLFLVYGYSGVGKTFLWKTLSKTIRSKGEKVLNVVSSGICSLLLTSGGKAHSRFDIPLNLNAYSLSYIKRNNNVSR